MLFLSFFSPSLPTFPSIPSSPSSFRLRSSATLFETKTNQINNYIHTSRGVVLARHKMTEGRQRVQYPSSSSSLQRERKIIIIIYPSRLYSVTHFSVRIISMWFLVIVDYVRTYADVYLAPYFAVFVRITKEEKDQEKKLSGSPNRSSRCLLTGKRAPMSVAISDRNFETFHDDFCPKRERNRSVKKIKKKS